MAPSTPVTAEEPMLPVEHDWRQQGLVRLGGKLPLSQYLRDVWSRRQFAFAVPLADMRSQNTNTFLGQAWHLLNPLLLIGTYFLIFGVLLRTDRGVDNYIAFLTVGVFTFRYGQKSATSGATSIVRNLGLMRAMAFPRAILPLSAVIRETLQFLPSLVVMLTVSLATGEMPRWTWLLLPLLYVVQFIFNLGLAFTAARFTERVADVQNVLPYAFRLAFYGSGVLYQFDQFVSNPIAITAFRLNPFHAFVSIARESVLDGRIVALDWAVALAWTGVAFIAGFFFFRAAENRYGRA